MYQVNVCLLLVLYYLEYFTKMQRRRILWTCSQENQKTSRSTVILTLIFSVFL
jgi:hypothetical protein